MKLRRKWGTRRSSAGLTSLVPDGEQGLELRSFGLFVDYGSLHVREPGFFEHRFEFRFAEAEPLVGVEFAGFFEAMPDQVEDDDATTGGEDAEGFVDGAGGVQGVMEGLGEEDQIDGGVVDGNFFHVAKAVFDVFHAVAEGLLAGDFNHFGAGVDGDDLFGALDEEKRKGSLTGAQIGNHHGG